MKRLYCLGITCHDFSKVQTFFHKAVDEGICHHGKIRELVAHSTTVRFIAGLRNHFLNTLACHRDSFPGVDGEGFFAKTVLHSLDHFTFEQAISDPLWLDIGHSRFGAAAMMVRIIKAGFASDVPCQDLFTPARMKDMKGPFYRAVYEFAKGLDSNLADHIDASTDK